MLRERKRRAARDSLIDFAEFVKPDYRPAWFHRLIASKLEAVERGDIKRLLICMPPQHGKSALANVLFPAWFLGRNPLHKVACCSYSAPLALKHSREAREVFVSKEYREVFPGARHQPSRAGQRVVDVTRQAAEEWGTSQGGTVRAVGVGGSLTGHTVHLGIIDDPHKDRAEADSETCRETVHAWYDSTLFSRLIRTQGPIVLIQTRWHPEDLAGWLLAAEKEGGEKWEKVILPALDDSDQALWPEAIPAPFLRSVRESYRLKGNSHEWGALFQQEPVLRGGNRFRTDAIVIHDSLEDFPSGHEWARCWDLASSDAERGGGKGAAKKKTDPDYTVGVLGTGVISTREIYDPETGERFETEVADLWVSDLKFCRKEKPARDALIVQTALGDGEATPIYVEAFGAYKDTFADLQATLEGVRTVLPARMRGDKSQKAAPLEPVVASGRLHLLRADWNEFLINQLREFPKGSKDDAVDALAILYFVVVGQYIRPGISRASDGDGGQSRVERAIASLDADEAIRSPLEIVNDPAAW